jgi:hypothetical protein
LTPSQQSLSIVVVYLTAHIFYEDTEFPQFFLTLAKTVSGVFL